MGYDDITIELDGLSWPIQNVINIGYIGINERARAFLYIRPGLYRALGLYNMGPYLNPGPQARA